MKRLALAVLAAVLLGCAPDADVDSMATTASTALTPEPAVVCGDGRRLNGEECDDGNTVDGDGCSATCTLEGFLTSTRLLAVCGDAVIGRLEECDDGNVVGGDGCSTSCRVEPGYTCSPVLIEGGATLSSCNANPPGCGDAVRDETEQCDDGDFASGDGCSARCALEDGFACVGDVGQLSLCAGLGCGDGVIGLVEGCDDGNTASGDGCSEMCDVEAGWSCVAEPIPCNADACTPPTISVCTRSDGCGDRRHVTGEQCDDGNVADSDGCSAGCLLEDGFTCFDVVSSVPQDAPPSYTRCEPRGCGDGLIRSSEGEECDDWNLASGDGCSASCEFEAGFDCDDVHVVALPELLGQRTVCTSAACGDGGLDLGEACDDGPDNGSPGYCARDCSGRLPAQLVELDGYALTAFPGLIAIIDGITLPEPICVDHAPNEGLFQDRLDFLYDNDFLLGRVYVAREAFVVESPLIVFDPDPASVGSRQALSARTSSADAVYGSVEVRQGEVFVGSIVAAPRPGECQWCGSGGMSLTNDFCVDPDGVPVGTDPSPCPEGTQCPETLFVPERAVTLDLMEDVPADPVGDQLPLTASCEFGCMIAGRAQLCTEPSGGGAEIPEDGQCFSRSIGDLRTCDRLGAIPTGGTPLNCDGGCEGRTDGMCLVLGAAEVPEYDLGCMFAGCEELNTGRCCSTDDLAGLGAVTSLDADLAWLACGLDPAYTGCDLLRIPPSLMPEGSSSDTIVQCQPLAGDRARRASEEHECRFCDRGLGNKCLPGRVPADALPARYSGEHFAPRPAEEDGDETVRRLVQSELGRRHGADPRRMQSAGDPIAMSTGEMVFDATDVEFPSRGVPLSFTRSYRSGAPRSGALGPGFSHNYEERIEPIADNDSTRGLPFCRRSLDSDDLIACLYHHDGHGGATLFTFDADSGLFVPGSGGTGVIKVSTPQPWDRRDVSDSAGVPTYFLTEPGGVTRTFDISGALLSIKDEMGFGVDLIYALRTTDDIARDGTRLRAVPKGFVRIDQRSLAGGSVVHPNRLNRMELVGIRDSYGRRLELSYETFFDSDDDDAAGREPRKRLHEVRFVDPRTEQRHTLVSYDYEAFSLTNEAYLTSVTRYGLEDLMPAGEQIVTEYEYAHDLFGVGGALEVDLSNEGQVVPQTRLAEAVEETLADYAEQLFQCQMGITLPLADVDSACGKPVIVEGSGSPGSPTTHSLWRILQDHLADNIVRIRRAGEVEIETRYGVNPHSPEFDRAIEQRYGALPAVRASAERVFEPHYPGVEVHRWLTDMPSAQLLDLSEQTLQAVYPEVLAAVPPVDHEEVADEGSSSGSCGDLDDGKLPLFALHDPAGRRSPASAALARTTASCAAIGARHARDIFAHDITPLHVPESGKLREQLAEDMNLVCRWVAVMDRAGTTRVHGLNFAGDELVLAAPSPSGAGLAITRRRVNADGNLVEEIRPDCSSSEVTWASDDDGGGFDVDDGPNFEPSLVLSRGLVTSIIERAPQDPARAGDPVCSHLAQHLEPPLLESSSGALQIVTGRRWRFSYEPFFQQMNEATAPDGTVTIRRYDYQQLPPLHYSAGQLRQQAMWRTGARMIALYAPFLGEDLDGDGALAETSAGLVLEAVQGVDLGGGVFADVGTRFTRNHTGRVTAERSIRAVLDPASDFDVTTYLYYPDLDHAERGQLNAGMPCIDPQGPLAVTTRLRTPDATDARDRVREFVAYDRLGGVRLTRQNDDEETTQVTLRNALGLVEEVIGPGALRQRMTHDGRGQLVLEESLTELGSETLPRTRHLAWGLQGVLLGECTELAPYGCAGLRDFALKANLNARAGLDNELAAPDGDGVSKIALVDLEDRPSGTVGPEGGVALLTRNEAGAVVGELVFGAPPIERRYEHDVAGRVVATSIGQLDAGIEVFYAYDGFAHLVATQTQAPLAQSGFTQDVGTIERTRYDRMDRAVARFITGDDGAGERRVLSSTRLVLNQAGAALFVHHGAGEEQPVSLPSRPAAVATGDDWASEELRYDTALRPVLHRAEGIAVATTASYDGLGLHAVAGRHQRITVDLDPVARIRTTTRVLVAEGVGGAEPRTVEVERFDPRGLLVATSATDVSDGVSRDSVFEYDELGQLRLSTDAARRRVRSHYDAAGRVDRVREEGPSGGEREREYVLDRAGRPRVERPARDAPETYSTFDAMGRLLTRASGDYAQSFSYDDAGRLLERRQGRGTARRLGLGYEDNARRPRRLTVDGMEARTLERDGLERVVEATELNLMLPGDGPVALADARPRLRTTLSYDALGRVVGDSTDDLDTGDELATLVRTFGDDLVGPHHLSTLRGEDLSFGYTPRGTLWTVDRSRLANVSVTFAHQGGLWVGADVVGEDEWSVRRARDAFGFVRQTALAVKGQSPTSGDAVLRGPTGKVVAERRFGPMLGTSLRGFGFDDLGRLKEQVTQLRAVPSEASFLSLVGEATAREVVGVDSLTSVQNTLSVALSDADALTTVTPDEERREFAASFDEGAGGVPPLEVNGRSIRRDQLDRIIGDGNLTYVFDALDRLVQVKRGPIEELLVAYDGLGRRRLERRQMRGGHVEDVVLEYDGANVIEESDRVTGAVLVATTHAQGIDAPLVTTTSEGTFVLRTNARGDVVAAAKDGEGAVVEEQHLDPWGERTIAFRPGEPCVEGTEERDGPRRVSGPTGRCAVQAQFLGRFGLAGARSHAGTKLVDLRNRVYAPHLRGFLTRDPLGNVDSESLFAYAAGDPINLRDPWGLEANNAPAGPQPSGGTHVGTNQAGQTQVLWNEEPAPPPAEKAKPPSGPCVAGADGDECRAKVEFHRSAQESRALAREERAQQAEADREARAARERDRTALERAKQASRDAWDSAVRREREVENRVGEAVEVVVEGGVHSVGLPQTSFGGVKPVGDAARGATGLAIEAAAGALGGAALGGLKRVGALAQFDIARTGHIFRSAAGHVNPATAASQGRFVRLFENVASTPGNLRADAVEAGIITRDAADAGVQAFTANYNGGQVWVTVKDGIIQNAGVNPLGTLR